MKNVKILIIYSLLIMTFVVSCKGNLDTEILMGKWYLNSIQDKTSYLDKVPAMDTIYFVFNKQNKIESFNSVVNSEGNWELVEDELLITIKLESGKLIKDLYIIKDLQADELILTNNGKTLFFSRRFILPESR